MVEYLGRISDHLRLPVGSSAHSGLIDSMIGWVHWLMILLFIGWGIYLIIAVTKFRSKSNPKADYNGVQSHVSQYAEIGVIIFEAFLLIGLSLPLWAQLKTSFPPSDEVHEIRVVAQQFAWNIHYPGADGKFGKTNIELVDEVTNPIGLDRNTPNGSDDIVSINQLHLPVNKQVMIHLSSKDVIHSFSLPEMRVKQDVVPGMTIPIYFTPTMTSAEFLNEIKGTQREKKENWKGYEIACAQLCGNSHYKMVGYLTVETDLEYDTWLAEMSEELDDDEDDW